MENLTTAKIFKNGHSQAIRLPKQFRFEGEEVLIYRQHGKIVIAPKLGQWGDFFADSNRVSPDFLEDRNDTPPQPRKLF